MGIGWPFGSPVRPLIRSADDARTLVRRIYTIDDVEFHLMNGRDAEAEKVAARVLQREPSNCTVWWLHALCAQRRGDYEAVVERIRKAFETRTVEEPPGLAYLGADALLKLGRREEAEEWISVAFADGTFRGMLLAAHPELDDHRVAYA